MARRRSGGKGAANLLGALVEGGNRLLRRRPVDLATFLANLERSGATTVLATADGQRDALAHLGLSWPETVTALARPETLPEVVERRSRVRVHPAAPWLTAGTAAIGTSAVLAGSGPLALEVLGVAGVGVATALGSGWLWRPRASRADRRFTVAGAPALAARAMALHSGALAVDAGDDREIHRLLALVDAGAADVAATEAPASKAGLVQADGRLVPGEGHAPAHHALRDELLLQRAELVETLLRLQRLVQRTEQDERSSRRTAYRQLLDDPLDDL
ncbi:hypothetical protein [Nocardioides sp. AE5]|uniref:hypothetical protein n=1 Tax=Nocardioides sp. AE5 TaxID=2962573 RepID=UPI002881F9AF|nr:hypothetical protein [Nocardioides sp. AE5]MDT0203589.1 hypothetical protein [Nocardioides sp. AE5]